MSNPKNLDDDTSPATEDGESIPVTEDGRIPYWYTARIMAQECAIDGDPDFWDRWKDEMKDGT
jgi:hypothetical protein